MLRFNNGPERGEIDHACARRPMVSPGELHVVDVKTIEPLGHGFQMHGMMDEAEVLLDLGVAGVMPIDDRRRSEFLEEKWEIAFEENFLERFTILDSQLEAARLGFGHQAPEPLVRVSHGLFLFLLALEGHFFAELLVLGRALFSILNRSE